MNAQNQKITPTLLAAMLLLLVSSCIKTASKKTWDIVSAGKGEWNIDELTVWSINYATETVAWDTTCFNPGTFRFYGSQEAAFYDLDAKIPMSTSSLGPLINKGLLCFATDLELILGSTAGFTERIGAQIVKIDRNELNLYCPSSLNTVLDGSNDASFYFKCSKK